MPDEKKGKNPLFSMSSPAQTPMSQEEIAASFAPDPDLLAEEEERKTAEKITPLPVPSSERHEKQNPIELPPRPPVQRRRNKKLRFTDIYTPMTLYIDKRIAPHFKEYLDEGESNTALANQIVLKILLDAGYDIDPTILTKPPTKRPK